MKTNSDFLTEQSVHRLLNLASIKKLIVLCNHAKDCTATNMTWCMKAKSGLSNNG